MKAYIEADYISDDNDFIITDLFFVDKSFEEDPDDLILPSPKCVQVYSVDNETKSKNNKTKTIWEGVGIILDAGEWKDVRSVEALKRIIGDRRLYTAAACLNSNVLLTDVNVKFIDNSKCWVVPTNKIENLIEIVA